MDKILDIAGILSCFVILAGFFINFVLEDEIGFNIFCLGITILCLTGLLAALINV